MDTGRISPFVAVSSCKWLRAPPPRCVVGARNARTRAHSHSQHLIPPLFLLNLAQFPNQRALLRERTPLGVCFTPFARAGDALDADGLRPAAAASAELLEKEVLKMKKEGN